MCTCSTPGWSLQDPVHTVDDTRNPILAPFSSTMIVVSIIMALWTLCSAVHRREKTLSSPVCSNARGRLTLASEECDAGR